MEWRFQERAAADPNGRMPLWALVEAWWDSGPRLAATTVVNYRGNLNRHILPVLGDRRIEEIRPRLVAQFLRRLQDDGMHPATARKIRTILSAVMSYAVAMEYAESNRLRRPRWAGDGPPARLGGRDRRVQPRCPLPGHHPVLPGQR